MSTSRAREARWHGVARELYGSGESTDGTPRRLKNSMPPPRMSFTLREVQTSRASFASCVSPDGAPRPWRGRARGCVRSIRRGGHRTSACCGGPQAALAPRNLINSSRAVCSAVHERMILATRHAPVARHPPDPYDPFRNRHPVITIMTGAPGWTSNCAAAVLRIASDLELDVLGSIAAHAPHRGPRRRGAGLTARDRPCGYGTGDEHSKGDHRQVYDPSNLIRMNQSIWSVRWRA
jgi:hypothetical protein